MRPQEFKLFVEFCKQHSFDWQEIDIKTTDYTTAVQEVLRRKGEKNAAMEHAEAVQWESQAENFDSKMFEDRMYIPTDQQVKIDFEYCLILKFNARYFGFGMQILTAKFKGNFMQQTLKIIEANKGTQFKQRFVWLHGDQRTMQAVIDELHKHNVYVQVVRNSPFRRDFLHFYNGKFYPMKRADFKEMVQGASLQQQTDINRMRLLNQKR